ncbi:MAG: sugar transferase [Segniliparus sp.]|uniref:sugar transferase n=1 Tax=Segniliparus sp. TaxID=2804064 RepID=UPI003F311ADB
MLTTVLARPAVARKQKIWRQRNSPYMATIGLLDFVALVTVASISHTWNLDRKSIWHAGPAWVAVFVGPLAVVAIAEALGVYRRRMALAALDTLPELVACGWMVTPFMLILAWHDPHPVSWWIISALLTFIVFFLVRVAVFAVLRALRRRDVRNRARTLVIGGGKVAQILVQSAAEHPEYGLEPVLVMDDAPMRKSWPESVSVIAHADDLPNIVTKARIQVVVVAFTKQNDRALVDQLRECDELDVEIYIVPRLYEFVHLDRDMDRLHTIPLVRVRRLAFRSIHWQTKRVFSVVAALLGILILSPLLASVALVVKAQAPRHPVFFKQERIGRNGKPFLLYKFRSMRPVPEQASNTDWSPDHTQRVNRFGSFIRKFSIDELPQLWNVVRGEMTLVGPRPERPHFVAQFGETIPSYKARHRVPVGLTGWAAIHGLRGDTSIADRAMYDNFYIENWSLWLDVKIIVLTLGAVLFGTGR